MSAAARPALRPHAIPACCPRLRGVATAPTARCRCQASSPLAFAPCLLPLPVSSLTSAGPPLPMEHRPQPQAGPRLLTRLRLFRYSQTIQLTGVWAQGDARKLEVPRCHLPNLPPPPPPPALSLPPLFPSWGNLAARHHPQGMGRQMPTEGHPVR